MYSPVNPQFYYIKVRFKGINIVFLWWSALLKKVYSIFGVDRFSERLDVQENTPEVANITPHLNPHLS